VVSLGRQGRRFVSGGPDSTGTGRVLRRRPACAHSRLRRAEFADSPEARARLALEELIRAGGFERSVLLLATPTGTGWVDPAGQDPVEYLFRGDIATVAVQYSYLNSPLALLTQAAYGAETARAVFLEIYGYWRTLPKDSRPRLFLSGLSLGSLNSDLSFDLFDIIDDPFEGVLWVGPPFRTESWRRMVRDRDPGSPAWLPRFRDGAVVRFMNQGRAREEGYAPWGNFRIVILQYPSDPITFFEPSAAWRAPAWMQEPRRPGRDAGPALVPDRHHAATCRGHGGRNRAARLWPRVRSRRLHQRVVGLDGARRLDTG
jgi:uncharacterized membrane protein